MKKLFYLIVFLSVVFASAQGLEPKTYVGNGVVIGPKTTTEINALTVTPNGYVQVNETTGTIFLRIGGSWINTGLASNISITDSGGNFTATDVEGALAELAGASGTDSGQTKTYEAGSSETLTLSSFLDGGSLTGREKVVAHTANDTITTATGLGQTGRYVSALHLLNGADSVYIKKGSGATLINRTIAYNGSGVSEDGIWATTDFILSVRPDGAIEVDGSDVFLAHTEVTALYDGQNPADPNNETSDVSMVVFTASGSASSTTARSTEGTRSIRVNTISVQDVEIPLQNITTGDAIELTIDVYAEEISGTGYVWLKVGSGWNGPDVEGTTYIQITNSASDGDVWQTITLNAVASENNPSLYLSLGNNETLDVDNIRYIKTN